MRFPWFGVIALVVVTGAYAVYARNVANPRILRELEQDPDGERAKRVMALTLPSGKTLPINYLREGERVYAGADFPWWRELPAAGGPVEILIRGERLRGRARAVEDAPQHRLEVFGRLRPTAPTWWGVLVEIELDPPNATADAVTRPGRAP